MYRPEKWECPYKPDGGNDEIYCDIGARDQGIFEAGADAMLEAIRKEGIHTEGEAPTLCHGKGWVVFIPDEQVKKDE